jgi:CubicO group peptidase (beta-lactamase class C family)
MMITRWCGVFVSVAVLCACSATGGGAGGGDDEGAVSGVGPQSAALAESLADIRREAGVRSVSAIAWRDGEIVAQAAAGTADARSGTAATPESIYMIASCSKPVVGLALAVLAAEQPIDLDADINAWLEWPEPLRNPAHPDEPITQRQLVTHRSSLVADDDEDYETYARPDPEADMTAYFEGLLPDPTRWEAFAPGEKEVYSNIGAALAAHVVETASGEPFSDFCRDRIFEPLGLKDTGWFFSDFDAAQVARMARPHDAEGEPLEHFGFPNWPSGQIRTTTGDLAKLWMAVQSREAPFSTSRLADFESVPFFIQADAEAETYDHSGSEYGVGAYFTYDHAGNGYAFLVNHEQTEAEVDALDEALSEVLRGYSGLAD